MSNLVIVAIPSEDDYVWKLSSEKKPHCTLLFLGDAMSNPDLLQIMQFVQHAVDITTMGPIMMEVDRRDVLGDDEADVLFFKKNWGMRQLAQFRGQLLQNNNIKKAYDSVTQFPEWQPHLTLGYPETPAHEDTRDYPGTRWVDFDRIAVWVGDFEGPEYRLEYNYDLDEVAMSAGSEATQAVLEHYGVKGMKWGQRKSGRSAPSATPVSAASVVKANRFSKTKVKATGGENHPATDDAIKAATARQKLKKSGVHALSNQELNDLANRLNLEVNVKRLVTQTSSGSEKFVQEQIANPKQRAQNIATGKSVLDQVKKAAKS